jgi:aryl-alcohol dehydrogenase-like predicted oxidoreductase
VAIAWTLKNPAVTAAIVGIRSPQQARGIAGGAELDLTPAEVTEIEDRIVRQAA